MTTKFGVFNESQYLHSPYVQTQTSDPRDAGLNFKASIGKNGKTNDATFDKFKPLYEGERYVEPLRARLLAEAEKRKKNVGASFKPASPMKHSATPGDFTGTLGGKVLYEPGTIDIKKKKGEVQGTPKNIVTGPSKRGSFGMPGTTLSERQGHKGVAGEYEYLAEPLDYAKKTAAAAAGGPAGGEGTGAPAPTTTPFKPSSPPKKGHYGMLGTTISGSTKGSVGEFTYKEQGGGDGKREPPAKLTPFRPGASCKSGMAATFGKYPEYLHDPETLKAEARAKQRAEDAKHGSWKPNHGSKTDCVRSIVRMNLK